MHDSAKIVSAPVNEPALSDRLGSGNARQSEFASSCPLCGSGQQATIIEIENLPVHVSALQPTAVRAKQAVYGQVRLLFCETCGFIHNAAYEKDKVVFEPGYDASLAYTNTFRTYVQSLAERLIGRYGLREKSVLEIGCGDGYFLRQLSRLGANNGIGIDPTVKREVVEAAGKGSVRFISDYFSSGYQNLIGDCICSMSVFETMPDPKQFLLDLRKMIKDGADPVLYFEVPNVAYMFDQVATWSIYYEQFAHFTDVTLAKMFQVCGYEVLDSGSCYEGDQYVYVEARPDTGSGNTDLLRNKDPLGLPDSIRKFSSVHKANVAHWQRELKKFRHEGKRVAAWGSAGKGSTFLNLLETADVIDYVVDINPERQGQFIPGSGQQVVDPEMLPAYSPDVIIITNAIYEQEIKDQVAGLGVECEFRTL